MSSSFQDMLEGRIDFEGQKSVDLISRYALIAITVVSFLTGFSAQSLQLTFSVFTALTLCLGLVILPPWPQFNAHPVVWAPKKENRKTQ